MGYAPCCAVFSASGACFLALIGTMLTRQPEYVKDVDDKPAAARTCFISAALYICCLLASLHAIRKSRLDDEARAESMGLGGRRRYMRDDLATGYKREGSPEEREPLATADRAARRGPLGAPSGYGYGTEADERRPHPAGVAML
jgi:hypothetical protein